MYGKYGLHEYEKGDYIYYSHTIYPNDPICGKVTYETHPGVVLKVGKRQLKVDCDGLDAPKWVSVCKVMKQENE